MTDARPEPLDLDAIERAAKAATPGEWIASDNEDGWYAVRANGQSIYISGDMEDIEGEDIANATYIVAAQPSVVLALVAECRRARAFLSSLNDTFANTMVELDAGPIENGWHKEYHRFVVDMLKWMQREQHTPHSRPGRLVNTTRHRDVTLRTYERPNESEGGE